MLCVPDAHISEQTVIPSKATPSFCALDSITSHVHRDRFQLSPALDRIALINCVLVLTPLSSYHIFLFSLGTKTPQKECLNYKIARR